LIQPPTNEPTDLADGWKPLAEDSFALWGHNAMDGLEYQEQARAEWQ
jgi:hypothetical protein